MMTHEEMNFCAVGWGVNNNVELRFPVGLRQYFYC